jgi:selenocysteine lyase/cysteine desulfurase
VLIEEDMTSQEAFQLKVENFVNSYPKKIKLAVLDHIISVPGFVCPIDALVEFFKEKKITLFVDGAHAVNQVHLDMTELAPDAYFSNFHKWSYAPKSAAFLYLSDKFVDTVQPAITGNFHGEGPAREYFWCGTRDLTPFLSVQKGMEYSESFGVNAVRNYNHALAVRAAQRVADIWGTSVLTKEANCVGFLSNARVPSENLDLCVKIAYEMMDEDNTFPIFYRFDGKVWIRLSAQIYNELQDYEFMATRFKHRLEAKLKETGSSTSKETS